MDQLDVWERESPPLPFAIHMYRDNSASYLVYNLDGITHSEFIVHSVAMSMVDHLNMVKCPGAAPVAE